MPEALAPAHATGRPEAGPSLAKAPNERPDGHVLKSRRGRAVVEKLPRGVPSKEARVCGRIAQDGAAAGHHFQPDGLVGLNRYLLAVPDPSDHSLVGASPAQPSVVLPDGGTEEAVDRARHRVEQGAIGLLVGRGGGSSARARLVERVIRPPVARVERQARAGRQLEGDAPAHQPGISRVLGSPEGLLHPVIVRRERDPLQERSGQSLAVSEARVDPVEGLVHGLHALGVDVEMLVLVGGRADAGRIPQVEEVRIEGPAQGGAECAILRDAEDRLEGEQRLGNVLEERGAR